MNINCRRWRGNYFVFKRKFGLHFCKKEGSVLITKIIFGRKRNRGWIQGSGKGVSFLQKVQTCSLTHSAYVQIETEGSFFRTKQSTPAGDHWPPFRAKLRLSGAVLSNLLTPSCLSVLSNHVDNSTHGYIALLTAVLLNFQVFADIKPCLFGSG